MPCVSLKTQLPLSENYTFFYDERKWWLHLPIMTQQKYKKKIEKGGVDAFTQSLTEAGLCDGTELRAIG